MGRHKQSRLLRGFARLIREATRQWATPSASEYRRHRTSGPETHTPRGSDWPRRARRTAATAGESRQHLGATPKCQDSPPQRKRAPNKAPQINSCEVRERVTQINGSKGSRARRFRNKPSAPSNARNTSPKSPGPHFQRPNNRPRRPSYDSQSPSG